MKNLILVILFICFVGSLWAQEESSDSIQIVQDSSSNPQDSSDLTKINWNILRVGKKRVGTRFLMLDIGINSYHSEGQLNLPASLETYALQYGRSLEVNLHIYRQRIKIAKGHFNIEHGLSIDFNHYAFQNDVDFRTDPSDEFFINNSVEFDRCRLRVTNLVLPIMLHIETNPKRLSRSLHIGVGAYGALRLGSNLRTRTVGRPRDREVSIESDNFGLNDFNAGLRAEVGYGPVNLYMKYSFTDLFKNGQGPNLTPFSVGLTVLPY